jgi:hypothetical protein
MRENRTLYTLNEIAEWARLHPKSIKKWIEEENIQVVHLGRNKKRIREREISNYLNESGFEISISPLSLRLLTVPETAKWAQLHTKSIYRLISENKLDVLRFRPKSFRIPEYEIRDFLLRTGHGYLNEIYDEKLRELT